MMTPNQVSQQRKLAEALMSQGQDASPVQHWTQALARVVQGGMGGYQMGQANQAETQGRASGNAALAAALDGKGYEAAQANPWSADKAFDLRIADRNAARTQANQLELIKQRKLSGQDEPSNVKEWKYFNGLPPDAQAQYLNMKRSIPYLNQETQFMKPNPITGQPMNTVPIDNAGKQRDEQIGDAQGKAIVAAPADISAAETALGVLKQIKESPYLEQGTGMSSFGNVIRGTGGYDFQNLVEQAKSGAFLSAIQQMRGMGSLSNAEGQTATAAVNRMNTATSKEAFIQALSDYEAVVRAGMARAQAKLGQMPQQMQAPATTPKTYNWTPDGGLQEAQ